MTSAVPSAPEVPLTQADYSAPSRECDIVMKGGITSGVVYPLAVCEMALDYRFRCIGGTSAGAIAAAATAAAEYGRTRGGEGFRALAELPAWLGRIHPATGRSNLFMLFQPQPETAAVFDVLTAGLGHAKGRAGRVLGRLLVRYPLPALLGALPGIALAGLGTQTRPVLAGVVLGVMGAVLAAAGGIAVAAWSLARQVRTTVPANGFGLCSGQETDAGDAGRPPALTPWLSDLLNRLAGKPAAEGPLTFGDLWGPDDAEGERDLDLRFMTTNLTHGRPYELPFASREFYYDPDEMRALFPGWVVDWMDARADEVREQRRRDRQAKAAQAAAADEEDDDETEILDAEMEGEAQAAQAAARARWRRLRPLPPPEHLPVVVGARMSLSFPLLISAVPLYAVDFTRRRPGEHHFPERCWFSDGGICSNFPVHFFDAPLPARPTFAINLRPYHPDHGPSTVEAENSWTPDSNRGGQKESWIRLGEGPGWAPLAGFAGAIMNAMQNWVDNTQLRVPGYRDRVVHVSLDPSAEGGMNLDMPPELIQRLGVRGQMAGRKLARRFGPGDGTPLTWDNHRWVRLRSSLRLLEDFLREMRGQYRAPDPSGRTYEDLVRRGRDEPPTSYRWPTRDVAQRADDALRAMQDLPFLEPGEPLFEDGAPRPTPELRIRPQL